MTNRVHIDAPAGVFDIEGEKDFVEGMLAKLMPLLDGAKFGSANPSAGAAQKANTRADAEPQSTKGLEDEKPKGRKRKTSAPPPGQSCAARIMTLKENGFFKEHRSTGDILVELQAKGWTHKSNQVAAALKPMFERGDIQRTKNAKGPWKYYWDRD